MARQPTLTEIAFQNAGPFAGFRPDDFAAFEPPGFEERMDLVRQRVKPKLYSLALALTDPISSALGETMYPHIAQHLRRSVNPPVETWVAFARTQRAYKPVVHYRAAVGRDRVRLTVFVEDYCDDKLLFARNLGRAATAIAALCAAHPEIVCWTIEDRQGRPASGRALSAAKLKQFARRLAAVKGQHAIFGVVFPVGTPSIDRAEFSATLAAAAALLRPIYDCGRPDAGRKP